MSINANEVKNTICINPISIAVHDANFIPKYPTIKKRIGTINERIITI